MVVGVAWQIRSVRSTEALSLALRFFAAVPTL
jgi:hypothetical protein